MPKSVVDSCVAMAVPPRRQTQFEDEAAQPSPLLGDDLTETVPRLAKQKMTVANYYCNITHFDLDPQNGQCSNTSSPGSTIDVSLYRSLRAINNLQILCYMSEYACLSNGTTPDGK